MTEEEYQKELETDSNAKMVAWEFLEYGKAREGYWTSDKFMHQIEKAYKLMKLNTQVLMDGNMSGYLIIAAAT